LPATIDRSGTKITQTVVVDSSVIINLIQAGRLHALGSMAGWEFVVPDQVVEEVTRPDQATELERAFAAGWVRREATTDPDEILLYAELKQRMGRGEAACLAMAATRGWMLASADKGRAFRRLVRERIGEERLIETLSG